MSLAGKSLRAIKTMAWSVTRPIGEKSVAAL
jgi:hypothetical protein